LIFFCKGKHFLPKKQEILTHFKKKTVILTLFKKKHCLAPTQKKFAFSKIFRIFAPSFCLIALEHPIQKRFKAFDNYLMGKVVYHSVHSLCLGSWFWMTRVRTE